MVFTFRNNVLHSINLQTLERRKYQLTPPKPADKFRISVEQIAVTSSADVVAVLWHEDAIGSKKTGRMIIQVLKISAPENGATPQCIHEFEMKDLFGLDTRESGRLIISNDASVVTTYSPYGVVAGYRTGDGSQIFKNKISETTSFAACSDPPLLAVADYIRPTDVQVFDAMTGKLICQIAAHGTAGKIALSPDGKFIYVGWSKPRVIGRYRVDDGSMVSEIKAPILPVAISPSERRFVGFYADAPRVGSLVLGDLSSAKIIERIADKAFVLDSACFSRDEDKIVYTIVALLAEL